MREVIKTVWVCPYCGTKHDEEAEALDCANECVLVDFPEQETCYEYRCDICNNSFDDRDEAIQCEDKHKEGKDQKYIQYLEEKEMEKLRRAAAHTNQLKLDKAE